MNSAIDAATPWPVREQEMYSKESGLARDFARQLWELRLRRGLTQAQLAERANTTQATISRLEDSEYQHSLRMIRKVARALGAYLVLTIASEEELEQWLRPRGA